MKHLKVYLTLGFYSQESNTTGVNEEEEEGKRAFYCCLIWYSNLATLEENLEINYFFSH